MSNGISSHLFSGAVSGFATTITLQPFDLLKTRVQQADGAIQPRKTVFETAKNIVSQEGVRGLWRGTNATLIRNVPGIALYMTSLTQVRGLMATSPLFSNASRELSSSSHTSVLPTLTSQGNLVAGATARVAVGFLLNPFSVLKARYESNMYAYQSMGSALVIMARSGPSELLKGFYASALRDAPYAGLFILFYERIKRDTTALVPPTSSFLSAGVHSFSAAAAGAIATMATHPFDVIKTKIQVRNEERYQGFVQTSRTIWQQRGFAGFFDGASLRLSRKIASSALAWAAYEGILIFIRTNSV